jgi:branched-chain amino acid transport system ATP-binding protein
MSILQVSGVDKSFGGVKANTNVSFSLAAGEMLALIGPNGAGKSTLFSTINGQHSPDRGSIKLDGHELVGLPPREIWRLGVGRTFQVAQPFSSMTVIENVQVALMSRDNKLLAFWSRAADYGRDEAAQLLAMVGMEAHADRPCNSLAYGDVKSLELAAALAHKPRLLLMDEPTAGMAPRERNDMMAMVRRLATSQNIAVLFTEHSMDVVFSYADRVIVLARGRVISEGTPGNVREDPVVKEVYLGVGKTFARIHGLARA